MNSHMITLSLNYLDQRAYKRDIKGIITHTILSKLTFCKIYMESVKQTGKKNSYLIATFLSKKQELLSKLPFLSPTLPPSFTIVLH